MRDLKITVDIHGNKVMYRKGFSSEKLGYHHDARVQVFLVKNIPEIDDKEVIRLFSLTTWLYPEKGNFECNFSQIGEGFLIR